MTKNVKRYMEAYESHSKALRYVLDGRTRDRRRAAAECYKAYRALSNAEWDEACDRAGHSDFVRGMRR